MERTEAIEVVRKNLPDSGYTQLKEALELLVPELKESESEDERMRKSIICALKLYYIANTVFGGFSREDMIAWLEKQGEQKPAWKPNDEQMGVIEAVINNRSFQRRHLDSLYEQLKKLREE